MLRPIFGDEALMGGVAYVQYRPAGRDRADRFAAAAGVRRIPRAPFRARRRVQACKRGGINAEISEDVRRLIWEKYVALVAMSGATTAMRQTIGPIRTNPLTRQFLLDLAREVVAVGRAHGVALPANYAEQRMAFFDGWPPEMTTSMHHDLTAGRRLEVQWLAGSVVDLGAQVGVPTPLNRAVRDILVLYAQGSAGLEPAPAGQHK